MGNGIPKTILQCQMVIRLLTQIFVIDLITAMRLLGKIHCNIGLAHQPFSVLLMQWELHNAQAGTHLNLLPRDEGRFLKRLQDFFGCEHRAFEITAGRQ
jgi:hypothetical protein